MPPFNKDAVKLQVCGCNFIEKESLSQVFPVNFPEFFRAPVFKEHLQWLLLKQAAPCV